MVVFLDRDGVINENREDYVKNLTEFRFLPGALKSIARLTAAGAQIFIITNQSAINRGITSPATVDAVNRYMVGEIERHGGEVTAVAWCPHRPDERCNCRKPRPGLLLYLANAYGISLHGAYVIGDALADIAAGQAVGCRGILVLTGRGAEQLQLGGSTNTTDFAVATDLDEAIDYVLKEHAAGVMGER